MPGPRKLRRICCLPQHTSFSPLGCSKSAEPIAMTLDEYEAIRLTELEGFSQEECAEQMICTSERHKLALLLMGRQLLTIPDGEYCRCKKCWKGEG